MKENLKSLQRPYIEYFFKLVVPLFLALTALLYHVQVTWVTIISFSIFYFTVYIMGTNIFFHRYWSHRQFKTNQFLVKFFTVSGLFSLVGGPIFYVLAHRFHHLHSDDELDPHSPAHGRWHAFIGWIFKAHHLTIPLSMIRDLLNEENKWIIKVDLHKIKIIYVTILVIALISLEILTGLIMAMFVSFFIELFINAFLHSAKDKTVYNMPYIFCLITAGGLMHKLHHDQSKVLTKEDPAYYLVKLIRKKYEIT